jgi:hypothetical protein
LVAGSGVLGGTLTVTAVNGVAAFADLEIDSAGLGFEIEFTALPALTPATSDPFDVAGPPAQLSIRVQPGGALAGEALDPQPVVEILDAAGVLVSTDNSTEVTATISTGTGNPDAVLSGTLSVTAVNGVVTFSDLAIDLAGVDYTLEFNDSAQLLTGATSEPFEVTSPPPPPSDDDGKKKKKDDGCTVGHGSGAWMLLFGLLAALAIGVCSTRAGRQ